jgi:flagellar biosynthesis/type III secretory pathway chaperone
MKNEKVYVLVKDEPEYVSVEILGVFSKEGKQKKLQEFAEKERYMLQEFLSDSAHMIETFKQKRAEAAYNDAKLLNDAGKHLTIAEIHMHERNLREIDALNQQINQFAEHAKKAVAYSSEKLASDYMNRNHLVFQEFVVE